MLIAANNIVIECFMHYQFCFIFMDRIIGTSTGVSIKNNSL